MRLLLASVLGALLVSPVRADTVVTVYNVSAQGVGVAIGTVTLADTPAGLRLTPDLMGLPPGERGFHVHQNGSCAPADRDGAPVAALAAGGHHDPAGTGRHAGPTESGGHLGDLPVLAVSDDGTAREPVTAPRLTLSDVRGRALMIHAGGDTFSDKPEPLGGGGARIACGVIPAS